MGCVSGWNKATNRSKVRWGGRIIRSVTIGAFDGTGNWSVAPSRFACGRWIRRLHGRWNPFWTRPPLRSKWKPYSHLNPGLSMPIKEKKKPVIWRPRLSWPEALRKVRAWLEPYLKLQLYWQAGSKDPPPVPLQALLDRLGKGQPICLYSR